MDAFVELLTKVINIICVTFLTVQIISIIVMVIGRYFFSYVPRGTEEFALFSMVWFSLLGISLSFKDDSHIKMEIIDLIVGPDKVVFFEFFAYLITMIFGFVMVFKGIDLVKLTKTTTLSGILISEGWLYLSLPVGGACVVLMSISLIIKKIWETKYAE